VIGAARRDAAQLVFVDLRAADRVLDAVEHEGRGGALMVWIGWLCVTALGWVFSWMLERIVQQGKSSSTAGQSVNDIVALFVASFSKLRERLIQAFPGYENNEWMIIILGIALVLFAILAYLHAQRLSGQFQTIESALDIATQGATTPAFDKNLGHYEASHPRVSKRKAKWLIIAVILGLLGFGILLSAVQQGYNTISFIMLGYSLAAVTAAVMMLIVHYTMRRSDGNLENHRYLPDWLYKTLVGATFGVLIMLLASLVILTGWASDFPSALAVFAIGAFLLLGTMSLAAGQIYLNIFRNENRWIGVRAQIDRRLHDLQEEIDRPIKEAQSARREQEARKRRAAVDKTRIQHELARMRHIFEEAYNLGRTAHEFQKDRLAREAASRTQTVMPAVE
jgi:ABC-type multidrug transport system fused ATPase/permease subunit